MRLPEGKDEKAESEYNSYLYNRRIDLLNQWVNRPELQKYSSNLRV